MKTQHIIITVVMMLLLSASVLAASMTRTMPSTVQPGSTFTITYTVIGAPTTWGASIVDNAAGGCMFPAGTEYKTVMLYTDGLTKTISVTAPSSGSCTFTGDYKFGTDATVNFPTSTISLSGSATSTTQPTTTTQPGTTSTTTTTQTGGGEPLCPNIWEDPKNSCKMYTWVIPAVIGIGAIALLK